MTDAIPAPPKLSSIVSLPYPAPLYVHRSGCGLVWRPFPWPRPEQIALARLAVRVVGASYGLPLGWWEPTS